MRKFVTTSLITTAFITSALVVGVASVPALYAQDSERPSPSPQDMTRMMNMMGQMSQMMDQCNQMMKRMMESPGSGKTNEPMHKQAPTPPEKKN